jgi:hypothetical protein
MTSICVYPVIDFASDQPVIPLKKRRAGTPIKSKIYPNLMARFLKITEYVRLFCGGGQFTVPNLSAGTWVRETEPVTGVFSKRFLPSLSDPHRIIF